ncbi:MAG: serine/threonine-protein kinase [Acidobacteria bacterium]|nr:serine/threonine-protein kinase [Acidobacteriota bacterium]
MSPPQAIAHYRITAKLGEGGMGEVYRATDTKLGREVAIKVLPESFAQDADRMARFSREAQVLAALNHPNIAQIYGVEERALILELVEGETLHGPLPVETALNYGRQIGDALEAAHEKGIIHRDLKPPNIKVTPQGVVKVLDFGLAAVTQASAGAGDPATAPTLSVSPTRSGMILGTAAYMSPEQARGKTVDKRADIWAFGVVLCEMLTGEQLFQRETISDTLVAVLKEEPDLRRVPAKVRRLLESCLQKDAKQRLQAIGDWRLLLDEAPERVPEPKSRAPWVVAAVAMLLAVLVALGWWRTWQPAPPAHPVTRWTVELPQFERTPFALSRDGSRLAYGGSSGQIYVRSMDQLEAKPLSGTNGAWASPFFSPDGRWIGYFAQHKLKKVPVTGGASITLCDWPDTAPPQGTWGPDDSIVFSGGPQAGLSRIAASGGEVQVLITPDRKKNESMFYDPHYLPGGKAVLFSINEPGGYAAVLDLKTGQKRILEQDAYGPRFVPGGYLVFMREATLFAVPFDVERLQTRGTPVPVLEGIYSPNSAFPALAFSDTGTLVYVPGGKQQFNETLVWVDRKGKEQPLATPPGSYQSVRISPDGGRVAFALSGPASADVYVHDLERGTLGRLTFESANSFPVWTPDGKRVAFASNGPGKRGLFWTPSDGSGKPEQILASDDPVRPACWTPDGKALILAKPGAVKGYGLWIVPVAGGTGAEGKPRPLLESQFHIFDPRLSPDGRWLAYRSEESGRREVYVQPFPGLQGKWQISTGGGRMPVWAQSGRELYYLSPDGTLMAVEVETGARFRAGTPRALFQGRYAGSSYDVAPDGKRFLMIKQPAPESGTSGQVVVVTEWFDELLRLVSTGSK